MSNESVMYNKPNVYYCGEVRLLPGANDLSRFDKKEVEAFKAHPLTKALVEEESIVFSKQEKSDKLSAEEAIELAGNTMDLDQLNDMLKDEKRKKVVAAIKEQIELLTEE